ncbi:MAG: hypothetical protein ACI4PC_00130 [Oscillospiraceae bacterium]
MMITAQAGQGTKYAVTAQAAMCGRDVCVSLWGGTLPHIGAVSLAVYEPERDSATVSTVCVHSHRDDAVAAPFAKAVSRAIKGTVTVSAGVHVDNASAEEIAAFRENCGLCCTELIEKLAFSLNP